jgi:hypothetical protein
VGVGVTMKLKTYADGEPCGHPGCLHHATHPCEGCGRIAGGLKVCYECGHNKFIRKYFDAGDHFGAGTSPHSEWCVVCGRCGGNFVITRGLL